MKPPSPARQKVLRPEPVTAAPMAAPMAMGMPWPMPPPVACTPALGSKTRSSRLPQVLLETVTSRTQLKLRPATACSWRTSSAYGPRPSRSVATAWSCAARRSTSSFGIGLVLRGFEAVGQAFEGQRRVAADEGVGRIAAAFGGGIGVDAIAAGAAASVRT